MDRRRAMKVAVGVAAGSGIGLFALSNSFKPESKSKAELHKLDYKRGEGNWKYSPLEPAVTAELAYKYYNQGSCMYAVVMSIISQLTEKFSEQYASFPSSMFKYGHGGIGGYGSICGTLNGAAALIGLFISDKNVQDRIILDIFQWYENEELPEFKPANAIVNFIPPVSKSNSVLCHASNTNWCNKSGFKVDSNERKERCRRLTGDVAKKLAIALNGIFADNYMTNSYGNAAAGSCVTCHGNEGKLNNTAVKMNCNPCHSESIGHRIFSDVHYKLMKK